MSLIRRVSGRRAAGRRIPTGCRTPRVGDVAREYDYRAPDQQWLYHHLRSVEDLTRIRRDGLLPGDGRNWDCPDTVAHCRGRSFFSAQITRWRHSYAGPTLRVQTDDVNCVYDGAEWLHDDTMDDAEWAEWVRELWRPQSPPTAAWQDDAAAMRGWQRRLSDCWTTEPITPDLIEFWDGATWKALR